MKIDKIFKIYINNNNKNRNLCRVHFTQNNTACDSKISLLEKSIINVKVETVNKC